MSDVIDAAVRLVEARTGTPIPHGVIDPIDRAEAFAIQAATVDRLGGHGGWKVGAAAPTAVPIFAPLPRRGIAAGGAVPASRASWRALEVEIAFRVGAKGLARGGSDDEATEGFDAVALAVEVVESRFADFDTASALSKLADLQSHGALLVGPPMPIGALAFDPARPVARLAIAGRDPIVTVAGNPAGDPRPLLRRLLRHAAEQGMALRPGDWVTTGSTTGLVGIAPGTAFSASIDGLGTITGTTPA